MNYEWALLYLDNLRAAQFRTRHEVSGAVTDARVKNRPFQLLRYRLHKNRMMWVPQETHFLANV